VTRRCAYPESPRAIARAEKQVELQAQLMGKLQAATTVNVLVSPEWREVQAALLAALAPYPDARRRAAAALASLPAADATLN